MATNDAVTWSSSGIPVGSADVTCGMLLGAAYAQDVMNVSEGGIASATVVDPAGALNVLYGGVIDGADVNYGGMLTLSDGAAVSGTLLVGGSMTMQGSVLGSGADVKLDITDRHPNDGAMVNGIAGLDGVTFSIRVDSTQFGVYQLAAGAEEFTGTFNVVNENGTVRNITVGGAPDAIGSSVYKLAVNASALELEIVSARVVWTNDNGLVGYGDVASGLVIAHDAAQTGMKVFESGSAIDITVTSGYITAYSGGMVDNTILNEDSWLIVSSGAMVLNPSVNSGGYIRLAEGAVVSGGTLYGIEQLRGGSAYGVVVKSGGSQLVSFGGLAVDTTVSSRGSQRVASGGSSLNTVIRKGGSQIVFSTGVAENTLISSGGKQRIASGGSAFGATVKGGGELVVSNYGIATDVRVSSGGAVWVSSGGYTSNVTVLTSGMQYVYEGGSAFDTYLSRGIQYVSSGAEVSGTYVLSRGSQYLRRGVSYDGVISGGTQFISLGGVAVNTQVLSGLQRVFSGGTASDSIVAGAIAVSSGGLASGTVVESGGELRAWGGELIDTLVKSGGQLIASAAGVGIGTIDMEAGAEVVSAVNIEIGTLNLVRGGLQAGTYVVTDGALNTGVKFTIAGGAELGPGSYVDIHGGWIYDVTNAETLGLTVGAIGTDYFQTIAAETSLSAVPVLDGADGTALRAGTINAATTTNVFYAANGVNDGNIALFIDGLVNSSAQIYGGGTGTGFAGDVYIDFSSGMVGALLGGAANNMVSVGNVEVAIFGDTSATVVAGGGRGNVFGAVTVDISGNADISGPLYGGAIILSTAIGGLSVTGDVDLNISGGTIGSDIFGAGRVNGGTATGCLTVDGGVSINVTGGKFASSKGVYGGGIAVGAGAETSSLVVAGEVTVDWNGGTVEGAPAAGRGIFGGALAADGADTSVGGVSITVNSGTVTNVFGGGWAQGAGALSTVSGNVNITVTGGTVANIFGAGAHAAGSAAATAVSGDVTITVSGGDIDRIYARGQTDGDTLAGSATVVVTGGENFSTQIFGCGYNNAHADEGVSTLNFSGYTGTLDGTIAAFDSVVFSGESGAVFSGAGVDNAVWSFDLFGKTTVAAVLDWDDAEVDGDTVNLLVSTGNTRGWEILSGGATTDFSAAAGYTLYIDGNAGIALELNGAAVSGTGTEYDGYTLFTEDNVLKFAKVSA